MFMFIRRVLLLLFFLGAAVASGDGPIPATLLWEGDQLARVRAGQYVSDPVVTSALERLRVRAERAVERGPYSVVDHGDLPPSGDAHDYVSFGTYWWPNPDTPDGLPYVRRDGVANKKLIAQGDRHQLSAMSEDVVTLVLAGYLLEEPKYSRHAAHLLRTWFLNPATRMNPHLRHGQMVRGVNTGRCFGIIDTTAFVGCIDSALLVEESGEWTAEDQEGLRAWFRDYLAWLTESPMGKQEGATKNNHATYYDVQVVAMAMFVGDRDRARRVLEEVPSRRLATQIKPDGRQPEEIARTRGLSYSTSNLRGFCQLARLGEHFELDLWRRVDHEENPIRLAAEFLLPYWIDPQAWPTQEIGTRQRPRVAEVGYLLATRLGEPKYREGVESDGSPNPEDISTLVFARSPRD